MKTDIAVIGAGHAGCEAALASARMGMETLLLTLNLESVGLMPCNPSIGGTGKGHLVREVDALGGEMGLAADDALIQGRMLNTGKGPAVRSLRAQEDKRAYHLRMLRALYRQPNLTIIQAEATEILTKNGRVAGLRTQDGGEIECRAVVVCTGVYLKSRIIIGDQMWDQGPQGLLPANHLSASLLDLGLTIRRFKTGTPARVDYRSIDFDEMEVQNGDEPVTPFSFLTDTPPVNKAVCYLTWTNERTHEIIRNNIHLAPMYSGKLHSTGARYCPSIEDKVIRFADKDRHQLFIEPEGLDYPEWYIQGMSSGLPRHVQEQMYRSIQGLHRAVLTRLAYAIEYDCIDPTALSASLAVRDVPGLFTAGQINGTSGYEEAAAQGLIAGMNAVLYARNEAPFSLGRDQAYIGVMTDDLTTKGTDEPYRMMTSRAEYRLYLRQDNADLRLTELSRKLGLATDERMRRTEEKRAQIDDLIRRIRDQRMDALLRRPEEHLKVPEAWGSYLQAAVEEAELQIKFEGYLSKEQAHIAQARIMESKALPADLPYQDISGLRIEARQKLSRQQPATLGQASRIPGVSPADIAVLTVWLSRYERSGQP